MKMKIAVFFGGRSVEHEVSVITGMQAVAALDREKYEPVPVYLPKDGGMYTGPGFEVLKNYKDIPALLEKGRAVCLTRSEGRVNLVSATSKRFLGGEKPIPIDVALTAVHGTFGEDGSLQGMFEMAGLPYTGCDTLSSAVCMDKPTAKALLRGGGLPVLDDVVLTADNYNKDPETAMDAQEKHFPYPIMVKPANLGSSVGITRANDRNGLQAALELAFSFSPRILAEPALTQMREINCAVIGDASNARPSVCEEPVMTDAILSYRDKYQGGGKDGKSGKQAGMSGLKRVIPANIPPEKSEEVQKLAVKAFSLLGCAGVVRIDFLWDTMNDVLYINELNTIPGSLSFYLWEATGGLSFTKMLDELIDIAFARQRNRGRLIYSHDVNILQNAELKGKD